MVKRRSPRGFVIEYTGCKLIKEGESQFSKQPFLRLECNSCNQVMDILEDEAKVKGGVNCSKCGQLLLETRQDRRMKVNKSDDGKIKLGRPITQRKRMTTIRRIMIKSCYNEEYVSYHLYGGKGIKVCNDWLNCIDSFVNWSLDNGYKDSLHLRRYDNGGDFEPSNCFWGRSNKYKEDIPRTAGKMETADDSILYEIGRLLKDDVTSIQEVMEGNPVPAIVRELSRCQVSMERVITFYKTIAEKGYSQGLPIGVINDSLSANIKNISDIIKIISRRGE